MLGLLHAKARLVPSVAASAAAATVLQGCVSAACAESVREGKQLGAEATAEAKEALGQMRETLQRLQKLAAERKE